MIWGLFSDMMLLLPISFIEILSRSPSLVIYFLVVIGPWGVSTVFSIISWHSLAPLYLEHMYLRWRSCYLIFSVEMRACSRLFSYRCPLEKIWLAQHNGAGSPMSDTLTLKSPYIRGSKDARQLSVSERLHTNLHPSSINKTILVSMVSIPMTFFFPILF